MRITAQAKADTQARILAAAARLLRRHAELTTRDVARESGIAHGTLFNYFPSKEHLYAALTEELAFGIRTHSQADLGLAVRAIPDPAHTTQNLSPGKTYIAVADGQAIYTREYNFAGRGAPDLTRITMYALNLVRRTLEGTL